MNKPMCSNCYDYLSSYEMVLNKHYKLDRLYCKDCMFGRKPIVENKYDIEKLALGIKGYKSWAEWGDHREALDKYVKNLRTKYGF